MRVYLIRHAHALSIAPGGDPHRPLSPIGVARAEALAAAFASLAAPMDIRPARLICSAALRAQQTAAPIAAMLGLRIETEDRVGLSGSADHITELIADLFHAGTPGAILIGHNPDLSAVSGRFGGPSLAPGDVSIASIAREADRLRGECVGRY
mgnify:CR=1 FL=1